LENQSTTPTSPNGQKQGNDQVWYGLFANTDIRAGIFTTLENVEKDVDNHGILNMKKLATGA
jgi:hypothetical protein